MADSMRTLNCFGVAGLLGSDCEVYYTNDLRARNVGRVSDLISAQLRDSNVDELRIRALLVYGIFQAYAIRGLSPSHSEEVAPVSLEIGIDPSYLGVGITFHWEGRSPNWAGLAGRLKDGSGVDPFEKTLGWIEKHSTQLLVRYEEKERRIEIVSLLNRSNSIMRDPVQVVAVDSTTAPLLEVSSYHELGDLDYSKLLRNPTAGESVKVFSGAEAEAEKIRISAQVPLDSEANDLRMLLAESEKVIAGLKDTISGLESRLESEMNKASEMHFKSDAQLTDDTVVTVKGHEEAEKSEDDWGFHFIKQVWPFAKKEDGSEDHEDSGVTDERVLTTPLEMTADEIPEAEEVIEEEVSQEEEPIPESEALAASAKALLELKEIAKSSKSKQIETTLKEIEDEVEGNKAKRWIDSLSSELLQEKAKLTELQKNLTKQIRQRELEFKSSERSLKHELKKKEELLKSREAALENKSEQIAQLNLAVERAGTASLDKEQGQIKMKLERAQKMAQMKEEESKVLVTKVRDLENRLIIAQAKSQKGVDLQMQAKLTTLEKKADEYKRVNQRLMESMNQAKEKTNDKEVGDLRRKIDQLERQSNETKRNLDKSAFKLRELQESERKLQMDLARAVEENRSLRKNQGRSGSGGGGESGGQSAA